MRFHMNGGHVPKPLLRPGQVVTGGSGGAESNLFWALVYVPQGTTAGALNVATAGGDGRERRRRKQPLLGARVCPSRTTAGALNVATAGATPSSMYEPNQFVMNCGVIDPTAGPIRIYSPISRNLNDGDKISLLIRPTLDGAATIISLCALCYHSQLNSAR